MQILLETTDWEFHNHAYLLNEDKKLVAYVRYGADHWTVFNKPLFFSRKGRKFKKIKLPLPQEFQK